MISASDEDEAESLLSDTEDSLSLSDKAVSLSLVSGIVSGLFKVGKI